MKVKAVSTNASSLPERYYASGYTRSSVFHIAVEQEYQVYGICVLKDILLYLIVDSTQRPNWYPSYLFRVTDSRIPDDWHYAHFDEDTMGGPSAVWGYKELATDQDHYNGLVERRENAMELFWKRSGTLTDRSSE